MFPTAATSRGSILLIYPTSKLSSPPGDGEPLSLSPTMSTTPGQLSTFMSGPVPQLSWIISVSPMLFTTATSRILLFMAWSPPTFPTAEYHVAHYYHYCYECLQDSQQHYFLAHTDRADNEECKTTVFFVVHIFTILPFATPLFPGLFFFGYNYHIIGWQTIHQRRSQWYGNAQQ